MSPTSQLGTPAAPRLHSSTWAEALERAATTGATLTFIERNKEPHVVPYGALLERSRVYARHLLARGLARGGRAMILLPTGEEWACAFFGTLLAGGVPVPVGPTFSIGGLDKHAETLRHIAGNCGARHFFGTARVEPYLGQIFEPGALDAFVNPSKDLAGTNGAAGPADAHPLPSADGDDLGFVQYTSGTTSMPKGVELTQRALLANAWGIGERLGMNPADTGVSWLPLFHDMGLIGALLTSLYWHYPLVLMSPELFLMQPRRWLEVISEYRATLSVAPNFAYKTALTKATDEDVKKLDLSRWRVALNGSESVLASTLREFAERFAPARFDVRAFYPVYGMAENCLAATFGDTGRHFESEIVDRTRLEVDHLAERSGPGPAAREIVSVGYPLSGQSVAIEGPGDSGSERLLDERQVGEILVRGPCLMRGYHGNPEATAHTLRGGWLHTGDLGFVADGRLFVTGRAKEMIIVRGRNYYPHDIEQLVAGVVGEQSGGSAAVGLFHESAATEELALIVEVESKNRLGRSHDDLARAINTDLIAALGIRAQTIVFVKNRTLPRTTSGKLQRTACRQRYLDGSLFPAD